MPRETKNNADFGSEMQTGLQTFELVAGVMAATAKTDRGATSRQVTVLVRSS